MGTWGAGLYSNDIAKDLKGMIGAVVRLPLDTDQLVDVVVQSYPEAANHEGNEDHTTFWLVLADQLHRLGIPSRDTLDRAMDIIDSGKDLNMPSVTEMGAADQRKRKKTLEALRAKISEPIVKKARKTLKKPQPLLMNVGDVLAFPILETGGCFNPYSTKKNWERADWGAAVVVAAGHAFEFLAHYTPLVINRRLNATDIPTCDRLLEGIGWRLARPGTCSKTHYARMQLETIGRIEIDNKRLGTQFPEMIEGTSAAVKDISIANSLYVFPQPRQQDMNMESLSSITPP